MNKQLFAEHGQLSETGKCRTCKLFIRVFEKYRNIHNIRGFCSIGNLEGDFVLYVSTSRSKECHGYIYNKYNAITYKKERELKQLSCDFDDALNDGRTKLGKAIRKSLNSKPFEEFFEKSWHERIMIRAMNQGIQKEIWELFFQMNKDKFEWLYNRKHVPLPHYYNFLNKFKMEVEKWLNDGAYDKDKEKAYS